MYQAMSYDVRVYDKATLRYLLRKNSSDQALAGSTSFSSAITKMILANIKNIKSYVLKKYFYRILCFVDVNVNENYVAFLMKSKKLFGFAVNNDIFYAIDNIIFAAIPMK